MFLLFTVLLDFVLLMLGHNCQYHSCWTRVIMSSNFGQHPNCLQEIIMFGTCPLPNLYKTGSSNDLTVWQWPKFSGAANTSRQINVRWSKWWVFWWSAWGYSEFLSNCIIVKGSPQHSKSNGGIKCVNCTVKLKLGHWMREINHTDGQLVVVW